MGLLAGALLLLVVVRSAWVSDDAYISFRTVHNFIEGHGLRWNVAERVQVFTHPLWLFLVAALYALGADVYGASLGLSFALTAGVAVVLTRGGWWGPAAVVVLAASKSFVDYSTSGLENPLLHLLLLLFLRELLLLPRSGQGSPGEGERRLLRMTLLGSLLALTRPDAVLYVAPGIALAMLRVGLRSALPRVALGLAPLLAWEAFSLVYYGDLVPNTARAKVGFTSGEWTRARMGLHYLLVSLRADPVLGPAILGGIAGAAWTRDVRFLAAAVGVLAAVAYLFVIGGDFMIGRFLAAPLLVSVVLLARAADRAAAGPRWAAVLVVAALVVSLTSASSPFRVGPDYESSAVADPGGLADERGYYFAVTGLFGRSRCRRSVPPVRWDGRPPRVLAYGGGMVPFSAGPGGHYVDIYAVTEPLLARVPLTLEGAYRPGHLPREIPVGYLESLESGQNLLVDPATAALWDDVRLVTRGPLWTRARWRAIRRLLLHGGARDRP